MTITVEGSTMLLELKSKMIFVILTFHTKWMESQGKVPKWRKKALLGFIFVFIYIYRTHMQNYIQAKMKNTKL